ncbi:VOC family protein [Aerococcaceae bacterium DSM 111176]|nr:VOC family protein [Aerococcaceae bacterium DSM 111176]
MANTHLLGIHHVTAITESAEDNYKFMTEVLGMRLVKKTVNQDDIHTYHTFFADDVATPGTDLTFFDFPNIPAKKEGTNSISRIGLRVPNDEALEYYKNRLEDNGINASEIEDYFGYQTLTFSDPDGQNYRLYSDTNNKGLDGGTPWKEGPVPEEFAIHALGPIEITVAYAEDFTKLMHIIYNFQTVDSKGDSTWMEVNNAGLGGAMVIHHDEESQQEYQGYGATHHVAFRVEDRAALEFWLDKYNEMGIGSSGHVDRFYFEALYARIGHILIELSTDGPGFMQDEPYETLGESLSLPPFIESRREYIESQIRPFDTTREH